VSLNTSRIILFAVAFVFENKFLPIFFVLCACQKSANIVSTEQRVDMTLIYSHDARDNFLNDLWLLSLPHHLSINHGSESNYKIVGVQ
jgi:hypothetical protein